MRVPLMVLCCSWTAQIWSFVQAYENLALKKPAWQNASNLLIHSGTNRAVDGQKSDLSWSGGQCAVSWGNTTAEWRVDLGEILSIHYIFIQYMTDNLVWGHDNGWTGRFLGFSLYLSNTTDKADGVVCFRDTSYTRATIPNPVNISCLHHGRYVIYYNNRTHPPYPDEYSNHAYTELCEVEVYGCPKPGRYGENCSLLCPEKCQENHCDIVDGMCLGCVPGYKGPECNNVCDGHTYGLNCRASCGYCSQGEQCNHVNGTCSNGCDTGVHGERCDRECQEGVFGYNCGEICSLTCKDPGRCDRKTGHCIGGCQAGWKGHFCENECPEGFYGYNCAENCSITCGDQCRCDRITGHCIGGCKNGWTGNMGEKSTFLDTKRTRQVTVAVQLNFPH